jgi:hypothetical protein
LVGACGREHYGQQRLISRALYLFKKSPVNREGSPFVAPNRGGEGGRVARNQALQLGLPQGAPKHSSNDADRVGALAGVALSCEELINIGDRQFAQNLAA